MSRLRKVFKWLFAIGLAVIILALSGECMIAARAKDRLYPSISSIPPNPIALVLGTAAETRGGRANLYFVRRMEAAAALYHAGKVRHLLLSGDNGTWGYNEPMDMRKALTALGVDSADMTLDFAGFSTYDSVVRAKRIFGVQRMTVVSQRFHNERALFIATQVGLQAIGFNASERGIQKTRRSWARERGARLKMWKDLALGLDPHFLGNPVVLGEQVLP
jgi:SanA protein